MAASFKPDEPLAWLSSAFIQSVIPMEKAIGLMETAFSILSDRSAEIPPRVIATSPDGRLSVFFKPAFLTRHDRMSIKILTQLLHEDPKAGPAIKGVVLLIGISNGRILAMAEGRSVTALRTGAASGLATRCLARPEATTAAIFGCGAQGRTQLEAILAVRPITRILLFDSHREQAAAMAREAVLPHPCEILVNPSLELLREADVICTATPSDRPLFSLSQVKPGVHINAVGSYRPDMQEIDPDILRISLTYLDDGPACLEGSGDLVIPLQAGIIRHDDIRGELGELLLGRIGGRTGPEQITLFKSVGNAIQDFFVVNEAYERSVQEGSTFRIDL